MAHPHIYMQDNITLDNFDEVLTSLSGAVRGAATNVSEQTTNNLAITSAVFMRIAELINTTTIIQDEVYIFYLTWFVTMVSISLLLIPSVSTRPGQYIGRSPRVEY